MPIIAGVDVDIQQAVTVERRIERSVVVVPCDAEIVAAGPSRAHGAGKLAEPLRLEPEGSSSAAEPQGTGTENGDPTDASSSSTTEPSSSGDDDDAGIPAWPFIVGALVIAAAVGIGLGVHFGTQPTNDTQLGRPRVESLVSRVPPLLTFD